MKKEKKYFELFLPEYNLCKEPGSPSRGTGWKRSEEAKAKNRAYAKNRPEDVLAKMSAAQLTGQKIEVLDLDLDTRTIYHSVKAAARALNINYKHILNFFHLNQDKPVLGRYIFKKLGVPSKMHASGSS
jgi:hypothetical protein